MTTKLFEIIAVLAFGITVHAQTNNTDVHNAGATVPDAIRTKARTLFLRTCAHCHGANARGDDGPDLHGLDLTAIQIANRIRKGKAGEMTAFAGKLPPAEIDALVAYVQSLK